ncbi:hydrogenase nickel incorporation protein HypB [Aestuariibacter salexigens]|uniref:hydrogenase nickel incorporation protein HypB n=1 Tax=Aestuariibacter salexigens TaxID=226010 RepID=UPI00041FB090|nr:hydrogenase nickel incorporation protein HypB [Aestuariibacter salexigens]
MCTVCGCEETHTHEHQHEHQLEHAHHHYGNGLAGAHAAGLTQQRMVQIERDILGKNNQYADANRRYCQQHGVLALNLVSSPGAGKTTLLVNTLQALANKAPCAVIEGDQQTSNDADKIRQTGVKAVQINTGKGCHLDAHMVGHAIQDLDVKKESLLFIENVGNLVCPAAFDLGERYKVAILSVTEGEDKPLKYPDMFAAADILLLNKVDLLPYVEFDIDKARAYARQVNPGIRIFELSATTGQGMDKWLRWLEAERQVSVSGAEKALENATHAAV